MKNERRYYIAYGSNLNVPQMRWRCPGATVLGTAQLKGWELLFKGSQTGSYLTIEEAAGGTVPVVVWEVTPEDEKNLDRYEGYPRFYYKKELKVRCKGIRTGKMRTVKAFVYIMHEDRPFGIPAPSYMDICREGYDTFYFDKHVLDEAWDRSADRREEQLLARKATRPAETHRDFLKGFRLVTEGGSRNGRK